MATTSFSCQRVFLEFIKKYGFNYNFGMSEGIIVNTKGELLNNEVYYLVRIVSWEILRIKLFYPGFREEMKKGFQVGGIY